MRFSLLRHLLILLSFFLSHSKAFLISSFQAFSPRRCIYAITFCAHAPKNNEPQSPFFFASVSNDNTTSTAGVVGTTAAAVGGAVALSEGGGIAATTTATSVATSTTTTSTTAALSGGRIAATSGGSIVAAHSAAIGGTAGSGITASTTTTAATVASGSAAASSSASTVSVAASTTTATASAGRSVASGATALGTIASSRATTTSVTTLVGGTGIVASEISSSSLEGSGIGAALESTSSSVASVLADESTSIIRAVSGAEDLLIGEATTDTISVAGVGEVADSLLLAAGEAGAGALSVVPGWLLSGGLAALASELAFAVFALFVFLTGLQAGGNVANEITRDGNFVSTDSQIKENEETEENNNTEAKEETPQSELPMR